MPMRKNARTAPSAAVTTDISPYTSRRTASGEAELEFYGDIVTQRPVDWWTDEPIEGNFIILSEVLDDLKALADVQRLTIRIHSLGGDAYDALAIHNRLRDMSAEVTVIVDGVAMSGGSVIMCAGDKVLCHPASLVMIHKCSGFLYGRYNADELRRSADGQDAVDRALAAAYRRRTGLEESELLRMMSEETYLTGADAVEHGFADSLTEEVDAPDIAASADRRTVYYRGSAVYATDGRPLPDSIHIKTISAARADEINTPAPAGREGGPNMGMTIEELRRDHPDLVSQLEAEFAASHPATPAAAETAPPAAEQAPDPAAAERARLKAIDEIAPSIRDAAMVQDAKYGHPCSAEELAFRALRAQTAQGAAYLADSKQDSDDSGAQNVSTPAASANEPAENSPEALAAQAKADVAKLMELMKEGK